MRRPLLALLAVLALGAAACGGDDDPVTATGDETTTTAAEGGGSEALALVGKDIAFDKAELAAPAGPVTIRFDNQDKGIPHNVHVTGSGVDEKTEIEEGPKVQELEMELQPGSYTYICDVHPEMKGTLQVG